MDSRPREVDAPAGPALPAAAKGEVEITKPRNDKRGYRRVVLPNALECLLISDPDTDKAAASMNVSVGNFCDPEGLEGLAHFLEHMLFYASEKYPIEDSYSKYIAEHGGSTNAFTSSEHTNFYFDVNNECLDDALDRFSQFFIKPLMSPDATLREIKAVDSENQKNLLSDPWRMSQLQKHLCSKNHPYHKFSTVSEVPEVTVQAQDPGASSFEIAEIVQITEPCCLSSQEDSGEQLDGPIVVEELVERSPLVEEQTPALVEEVPVDEPAAGLPYPATLGEYVGMGIFGGRRGSGASN